jgi:glycosyltransferase involved in cell wall biosynthesis
MNKKILLANFIEAGGIRQYFESLKAIDNSENVDFLHKPKIGDLLRRSKNGHSIIFTHLTKEVLAYLFLGGRGFVIWHDPKLRVGYTARELILYIGLNYFRSLICGIIVHSEPDDRIKVNFKYLFTQMPLLDARLYCNKTSNYESKVNSEGLGNSKVNLLFFGRVLEYKGLHKYIEVYKVSENIRITIAGEVGSAYKKIFENIKNIFLIDRFIDDNEIIELISAADYVFMPYSDVTNTHIHTLAFEAQKPVIRTDISGFQGWSHVCSDLIFKEGSSEGLQSIFRNLASSNTEKYERYVEQTSEYLNFEKRETQIFWSKVKNFVEKFKSN